MAKRLFDIVASTIALVALAPVMVFAGIAILVADGRPVLYRTKRSGLGGTDFTLLKFRSMRHAPGQGGSVVTSANDPRVFAVGQLLRKTKIDELPQLLNILQGDMSVVGPRPEDPRIVEQHFTAAERTTLDVRPGLASPGSIYNYTHGENMLTDVHAENVYVEKLLPIKMALERVYLERQSMLYDLRLILRTLIVIAAVAMGREDFADPPEMDRARELLAEDPSQGRRQAA